MNEENEEVSSEEALTLAEAALDAAIKTKETHNEFLKNLGPTIGGILEPFFERLAEDNRSSNEELLSAVKNITINVPKNEIPQVNVPAPKVSVNVPDIHIPEIKLPKITVPKPEVTVNVPKMDFPKFPDFKWPDVIKTLLHGVDRKHPVPVLMVDLAGEPFQFYMGGGYNVARIVGLNQADPYYDTANNALKVNMVAGTLSLTGLLSEDHNIGPSGSNTLRVTVATDSVASTNIVSDYRDTNIGPSGTNTLRVTAATDSNQSVNITGGSIGNTGFNITGQDENSGPVSVNTLRVVQAVDVGMSVNIISGSIANTGFNITGQDENSGPVSPSTLRVVNAVDVATSVNIISGSIANTGFNITGQDENIGPSGAQTLRVTIATDSVSSVSGSSVAGKNETTNDVLRVIQMTDTVSSANIVTFNGNVPSVGTNETQPGVLRVTQMTDTASSVNIVTLNGNVPSIGLNETNSGVLRVVQMTDSNSSVNITNASLPVTKSGTWAIDNSVNQGDAATALRVVVAGNSDMSVVVNSGTITNLQQFNGNTPAQGLNETTAGVLRVVTMSDTVSSVNVTTFNGNAPATGFNETTSGVLRVIHMSDVVSSVNVVTSYEDHNSGPTGANTLRITMATDSNSSVSAKEVPDATSTYAPSAYDSTAYETTKVVKASAGVVYSIYGYNSSTAAIFIQAHNASTQPNDGVAPLIAPITVPGTSNFYWSSSEKFGKYFSTGITVLGSTTGPTKTIISDSSLWFDVQYQ